MGVVGLSIHPESHKGVCYVRRNAPAGLESNWMPTKGKTPYLWLPLYGPDEVFWNKSFKMPDVELVK